MKNRDWMSKDWSVILLQEAPQGIVCVRKPPRKDAPEDEKRYWQFPGGKRDPGEKPKQTVIRENREETGILVTRAQVQLVGKSVEYNHHTHHPFSLYFYVARITDDQARSHSTTGIEGEEVRILTWDFLRQLWFFSPFHRALARRYGVWKK